MFEFRPKPGAVICINRLLIMFWHALRMSNQSAAANVHLMVRKLPAPETADASDPVPNMRRQITLLNIEVEHLRAKADEARQAKCTAARF
jgi:hypothetical protein